MMSPAALRPSSRTTLDFLKNHKRRTQRIIMMHFENIS